ncbi:MAG: cytidine deaminase [Ruminococcaceae bacterium]|nr:cytidine deaminase [Oscillospiraceae bacterium]
MGRRDKINYYLDIAETVMERCTCIRRHYGAIIVKNDQIISTGYVGAPRGRENCTNLGYCRREQLNIPRGERYEMCRSVHAEQNAIIHASRNDMIDSTLYLVGKEFATGEYIKNANPCSLCKRFIINAGIKTVVLRDDKENYRVIDVQSEYVEKDESLSDTMGY